MMSNTLVGYIPLEDFTEEELILFKDFGDKFREAIKNFTEAHDGSKTLVRKCSTGLVIYYKFVDGVYIHLSDPKDAKTIIKMRSNLEDTISDINFWHTDEINVVDDNTGDIKVFYTPQPYDGM